MEGFVDGVRAGEEWADGDALKVGVDAEEDAALETRMDSVNLWLQVEDARAVSRGGSGRLFLLVFLCILLVELLAGESESLSGGVEELGGGVWLPGAVAVEVGGGGAAEHLSARTEEAGEMVELGVAGGAGEEAEDGLDVAFVGNEANGEEVDGGLDELVGDWGAAEDAVGGGNNDVDELGGGGRSQEDGWGLCKLGVFQFEDRVGFDTAVFLVDGVPFGVDVLLRFLDIRLGYDNAGACLCRYDVTFGATSEVSETEKKAG